MLLENHTLHSGTYPYSLYTVCVSSPQPRGFSPKQWSKHFSFPDVLLQKEFTKTKYLQNSLIYSFANNFIKENPDYESTYVFENDFPALLQEPAPSPGT